MIFAQCSSFPRRLPLPPERVSLPRRAPRRRPPPPRAGGPGGLGLGRAEVAAPRGGWVLALCRRGFAGARNALPRPRPPPPPPGPRAVGAPGSRTLVGGVMTGQIGRVFPTVLNHSVSNHISKLRIYLTPKGGWRLRRCARVLSARGAPAGLRCASPGLTPPPCPPR